MSDENRHYLRPGAVKWIITAILFVLIALTLLLLQGAHYSTRLRDGVVVLTGTGCQVLAYHGAKLDYLDGGALCAIRAPSRFGDRADTGRIQISTEHGDRELRLSRRDVVSTAY